MTSKIQEYKKDKPANFISPVLFRAVAHFKTGRVYFQKVYMTYKLMTFKIFNKRSTETIPVGAVYFKIVKS